MFKAIIWQLKSMSTVSLYTANRGMHYSYYIIFSSPFQGLNLVYPQFCVCQIR